MNRKGMSGNIGMGIHKFGNGASGGRGGLNDPQNRFELNL